MATACRMAEPSTRLRAALPRDVPAVALIEAACFSDPWPESAFRSLLRSPAVRFMVAVQAQQLCGYSVVIVAADEAELANIAVAPTARRQGVGQALLQAAIAAASAEQVASMYLEVRESNVGARALYASHGFELMGRRRAYYRGPDEDALVLVRRRPDANEATAASAAVPTPQSSPE